MADRLFPLLLVLTLLDLGFVQATQIVSGTGMLPLWLLCCASPLLRRQQQHRVYRAGWNLGVLVVFALLVHHATTTGLLHMLEDGLLLAVLCQVHLLNNVGRRQRPDLLFFNSFLIAFVTSFFAPDLSWSLLFVAHAFVLVPALELRALADDEGRLAPGLARALLRDSWPRTVAMLALTAVVFVAWPRDFERSGWLGEALSLGQRFDGGIAERIRIDDEGPVRRDDRLIARLEPASGSLDDVPSHWRALAFATFDGVAWSPQHARHLGSHFATDVAWQPQPGGAWQRSSYAPARPGVRVRLLSMAQQRLLVPLAAVSVEPADPAGLLLDPKADGGFVLLCSEDGARESLVYTVGVAGSAPNAAPAPRARGHLTALPPDGVPRLVADLARQLRERLPRDADALAIAHATARWLQQNRRYQLPGQPGFARNLGEFLLGSGAGHCEYFATALALLLRVQDVPCRLVGGYLAHERDDAANAIIVRARDAHAWVEALAADGTWHTFDATPAADLERGSEHETWWQASIADLQRLWSRVTGFDADARSAFFAALLELPQRRPLATALGVALLTTLVWLRRRRPAMVPVVAALDRAVRRAGLTRRDGETPRELLERAAASGVAPRRLGELAAAARAHEAARYRNDRSR